MAKRNGQAPVDTPVQPVEQPIICNPYQEPKDHWVYDKQTGQAKRAGFRRPAGYWYKTDRTGSRQRELFFEEERDDLPLVNRLREDVRRWREADYRGASNVTKDLLRHWASKLPRPLFFCQREAAEIIIYLAEVRIPGKTSRTGFRNFEVSDKDLVRLLRGEPPSFESAATDFSPKLVDLPANESLLPLCRLGCKMATGSGKTVVMAMLIAWAFCNRAQNPESELFPSAVLICCPNLTIKERLQVLRPEREENYYEAFDLVPVKHRTALQKGKVLVTNWHWFLPESEHKEGDQTHRVVKKGPETPEAFAKRILGDLYDHMPLMVLNDEGHHCWRPAPPEEDLSGDETLDLQTQVEEATVWTGGLDRINNAHPNGKTPGISLCVDMSATPFYIKGSGHPEGRPFPWLVSDFGLVDAIECGIVKIPRLPVQDVTGRPDPKYFKLWEAIKADLQPAELVPGRSGRPKPEVVYREAEGALQQIAGQWVERLKQVREAKPGQEHIPPVLIIVCDNTDIAEVLYRRISGEREEEVATEEDLDEAVAEENGEEAPSRRRRSKKAQRKTVYGKGDVCPEYLSNTETEKRTIRIDTKLLAQAESDEPGKTKQDAAEELRRVVSTVGKAGQPGEHVRCVVSVAMLNEGWDANNVTQVLGIRAFGSQLLCEQVVGRGLRRMDYDPDPETGMLDAEYVDVYGIPFSVIPFKGRPTKASAPEDKPKNHVVALPERVHMEIRFPVVEGYVFALQKNLIKCDVDSLEPLVLQPGREPTATFVLPTVGYKEGHPSQYSGPGDFMVQDRESYYRERHLQEIEFLIAARIVYELTNGQPAQGGSDARKRIRMLHSRHLLFPQVYRIVDDYVRRKVGFGSCHPCELGLERYVTLVVERLREAIEPDETAGEPPLLPVLNRYKSVGTTADVNFKTTRPCIGTSHSHVNQVVADTKTWEQSAAFHLERLAGSGVVDCYVKNDHLGFVIEYEHYGVNHSYEPDFLIRLKNGLTVVLEVKGYEGEEARAKHTAAKRWVSAVNNWGRLGTWAFHVCRDPQLLGRELEGLLVKT